MITLVFTTGKVQLQHLAPSDNINIYIDAPRPDITVRHPNFTTLNLKKDDTLVYYNNRTGFTQSNQENQEKP